MTEPVVAIPAYRLEAGRVGRWAGGAYAVPEAYIRAVRRAGMEPVILSGGDPTAASRIASMVDALLLIGGGDVDPGIYGGGAHPAVYGVDTERDALEVELVHAARAEDVPVLAVCRGAQVVNVAFGGTLVQHLPEIEGTLVHRDDADPTLSHDVKVSPGTRLAEACGAEIVTGASHHHQAVDKLGRGLVVSGRADDGVIEALEAERGWLLAVQWHPEETAGTDSAQQALFDALARQATRRLNHER
jgi:putative glutamine amidotransferase